jgi:antitoxin HicB
MKFSSMPRHPRLHTARALSAEHGYKVIFDALKEGGFQVIVPALPGIVTYGRTLEEAREMARDAIVCHLRGLLKDGEEIPQDPFKREQPVTEELKVTV